MALTKPTPAMERARLRVLQPDGTDYVPARYLSADGASWNHSKAVDGSALNFTANHLEPALAADQTMLEEAFVIVEVYTNTGTVLTPAWSWQEWGTPYALAPGTGKVIGPEEGSAKEQTPISVGALQALASECIVLPNECDDTSPTMRYACGGIEMGGLRFFGWQSKGYDEGLHPSSWNPATVYTPASGAPKENQPENWDANAASAKWVYATGTGGLTLLRIGTFTLTDRATIKFIMAADEGAKLYLDGPNQGGIILESQGDETGYTEKARRRMRLEPGTYRVSAEFTTVDSTGGDGNDSLRFACGTIDTDGNISTLLLATDTTTSVCRQGKEAERPGMAPTEVVRRMLQDNVDQGVTGATILLGSKDFTDALDSAGNAPAASDCREWVWPLGTSVASCLVDMSEDADFDLTPGFVFRCWLDRGADLSATVVLTPGGDPSSAAMNILDYSWNSDPAGPTRYLTLSQDGYDILVGTTAEAGTRPRFGFFESGASASIGRAKRNARSAIRQTGTGGRRYYQARVLPIVGAIPGRDFTVCDVVNGRGYRNLGLDLEVTDIGAEQNESGLEPTLDMTEA